MDVTYYDIEFVHGNIHTAHCSEFMSWSIRPQIHVWAIVEKKEVTFNFYKCPNDLYWFELLPNNEELAYKIASVLGRKFKLQVTKRPGIQVKGLSF